MNDPVMTESDEQRERILRAAFDCRMELIAYACSLLGNYAAAEEAVQEALLVVVKKHDQFEEGTSLLAWCRSIVRIEVLRAKQRYQRERSLVQRLLDDAIDAAFEEFQEARSREEANVRRDVVGSCLQRLPQRGQQVLKSRFVDQLAYQQIGERLQMSVEAVRKALFRCKRQVRECVESKLEAAR